MLHNSYLNLFYEQQCINLYIISITLITVKRDIDLSLSEGCKKVEKINTSKNSVLLTDMYIG